MFDWCAGITFIIYWFGCVDCLFSCGLIGCCFEFVADLWVAGDTVVWFFRLVLILVLRTVWVWMVMCFVSLSVCDYLLWFG